MLYVDVGLARATQAEMVAFAKYCGEVDEPFPIERPSNNDGVVYGFGEQSLGYNPAVPLHQPVAGYYLQRVSTATYPRESVRDFVHEDVDESKLAGYGTYRAVTTLKYVSPQRLEPGFFWTGKELNETTFFGVVHGLVEPEAAFTIQAPDKPVHQGLAIAHALRWLVSSEVRKESQEFRRFTGRLDKKNIIDMFNHLGWAASSLVNVEIS
jgi:hypothetical protein